MAQRAFRFTLAPDLKKSERRAVGFLEEKDKPDLNGKQDFDSMEKKASWTLKTRIDYWVDGNNVPKKYFHGWDHSDYRSCFVFKREDDRFYGFKCHPKPKTAQRFELCVLVFHDVKNEEDANYTLLDRINLLRKNPEVITAICITYPEYRGE